MEALKRARRPVRVEFEHLHSALDELLKAEEINGDSVAVKYKLFCDTFETLQQHDNRVLDQYLVDNLPNEEEDAEYAEIRKYKERFEEIRHLKDKRLLPTLIKVDSAVTGGSVVDTRLRALNLPTVKIRKFSGELKDWLGFWAQFQKVDEDEHLHGSDKFWYLLQAVEPKTDAYEIISGYAQSNENYPKVVEALKKHYGNTDVLLQVYLRELLELVISNVKAKEKIPLKNLFLKLDSHLRSLKTLNLEKADPATWLFPLVESCLPEDLMYNWQRSPMASYDGSKDDPPKTRLDILMGFMEKEVAIKQRIDLTRNFNMEPKAEQKSARHEEKDRRERERDRLKRKPPSTLSSFYNSESKACVFCEKPGHATENCYAAKHMTYNEKIKLLATQGICYRCCRGKHFAKSCKESVKCSKCGLRHQTIICRDRAREEKVDKSAKRQKLNDDVNKVSSLANVEKCPEIILQTLYLKLKNGKNERVVRAFIDSGSQRSYLLKSTVENLGLLPKRSETVVHSLFGDRQTSEVIHQIYEVNVIDLASNFAIQMEVRDQNRICGALPNINVFHNGMWKELQEKGIQLYECDSHKEKIEMLIGADCYAGIIGENVKRLSTGAVAIQTRLGWTIMGKINSSVASNGLKKKTVAMKVTDACVTSLWELDTLGIRDPMEKVSLQEEEKQQIANFKKRISRLKDGRYSVKFPWKMLKAVLPTNREVAIKRLYSATKKLELVGLVGTYGHLFKEWEEEGFIEKVQENVEMVNRRIHYIPHRAVVKPQSLTTPVRPVFDASCRVGNNPSLNDMLFKGENLLHQIPSIMLGFRKEKVGFVSDIRKAFQMIAIDEEDRDAFRFFWWNSPDKVMVYRHARVPFGANCSPFILLAVVKYHLDNVQQEDKATGKKLADCFYADNCVGSETSLERYQKFRKNAIRIMNDAKMELRMWFSNKEDFEDPKTLVMPVLGLLWNRKRDVLHIKISHEKVPEKVTKRVILSRLQKIYDPMGFVCPALLNIKLLLQKAWRQKLKWDEEVSQEDSKCFLTWENEVANLEKIKIPRLATNGDGDMKCWWLHTFTDASKNAYAAAVYLRSVSFGQVKVQLLIGKSRVAPVKELTILRLELMGCLLGARLAFTVKKAMNIDKIKETLWTDSKTAEAWIKRQNQWEVFVANRVKEIVALTDVNNWSHIPGKFNPADLPSRGCTPTKLAEAKWHKGPNWLYEDPGLWPVNNEEVDEEKVSASLKKVSVCAVISLGVLESVQNQHSYWGYVRIFGYMKRYIFNYFCQDQKDRRTGELSVEELALAETAMLLNIQSEEFTSVKMSKLIGLDVFKDESGLLGVKSRITYRHDSRGFKFPVLLPNNRKEIRQLIMDTHVQYCHAGTGFLFCILRKRFWVLITRRTIKDVIAKCITCRKFNAKPRPTPPAPLPLDRIKDADVFEVIGVDLAGPLLLKNRKKTWFVIFTCAIYRAVHFEVVNSMTTQAFLAALGKFIKKFRRPKIIYSDNGSNFRGCENFFNSLDWEKIKRDNTVDRITWKWLPVASPWWGGWWERLIGVAKNLLKRTVGKGSLNRKELEAVMDNVAETMNNRPLTHLSENSKDLETLTPNHFLHPFGSVRFPEQELSEAQQLRFRFEYVNTLRKELQGRFLREYLGLLVNKKASPKVRELNPGEIVLVGTDNKKRITWPLGRVIEMIPGKDGACRIAKVRTQYGESIQTVQRLYPLELDTTDLWSKEVQRAASDNVRRSTRDRKPTQRFGFFNTH